MHRMGNDQLLRPTTFSEAFEVFIQLNGGTTIKALPLARRLVDNRRLTTSCPIMYLFQGHKVQMRQGFVEKSLISHSQILFRSLSLLGSKNH